MSFVRDDPRFPFVLLGTTIVLAMGFVTYQVAIQLYPAGLAAVAAFLIAAPLAYMLIYRQLRPSPIQRNDEA